MQLKNARILLTGASGGLGHELASQLSTAGAALLLAGRDERRLNEVRAALPEEAAVVVADLTSTDGIARTARAAEQFRANVLINNAGAGAFGLAAASLALFGTGVAAADDYAGQSYSDASSAASDAGMTVVIASSGISSPLAWILNGAETSTFSAPAWRCPRTEPLPSAGSAVGSLKAPVVSTTLSTG